MLIAVDDTEESVHTADVAARLNGEEAEYFAVSVADGMSNAREPNWWGTAWGIGYPVRYGVVWPVPGLVRRRRRRRRRRRASVNNDESPVEAARRTAEETARDAFDESNVEAAEPIGEVGHPSDAIVRAATERCADVILFGSHDRSWFGRVLHDSVGKVVIRHSTVPVLVTPAPADHEGPGGDPDRQHRDGR